MSNSIQGKINRNGYLDAVRNLALKYIEGGAYYKLP